MAHICKKLCLIMLSLVHAVADSCLIAITEETTDIPCYLKTKETLKTEDLLIEWTTFEGEIVHAFMNGGDYLNVQDPRFKGRTQLFRSELSHGNFSLRLSNVSVSDEGEFVCSYSENNYNTIMSEQCLHIAGHYSFPVVSGPPSGSKGREANFTCKSTGGFPEPKVHWSVNKEPLQDLSQVKTTLRRDRSGCYNMTSVLNLNMTEDVSVACTVENERLREKRASAYVYYLITTEKEREEGNRTHWVIIGVAVGVVILLIGVVVILKKK